MNLWAYWFSDTMVLKLYNASEVDATIRAAALRHGAGLGRARRPADAAGLPDRRAAAERVRHRAQSRARRGRRDHAASCSLLSARELRGVMAHELAHVRHRDILTSTITATMAGAISTLAQFGMFFGGRGRRRPQSAGRDPGADPGADRRDADPARHFPRARVRGRPRRRRDLRRPASARRRAGEDRALCARACRCAAAEDASGDRADDDHQPAVTAAASPGCSARIRRPRSASAACSRWLAIAARICSRASRAERGSAAQRAAKVVRRVLAGNPLPAVIGGRAEVFRRRARWCTSFLRDAALPWPAARDRASAGRRVR